MQQLCTQCAAVLVDMSACSACGHANTGEHAPGTILGSYRVLDLIGAGGMGHVYIAEHIKLGRRVALKMLRPQYCSNPMAVTRFFAEARAVNRISHENIVEVTDFIENPGGANYYIMELLKGEDLGQLLIALGIVPLLRAVDIATQVASVLVAVHAAKIVHRDLKPDNIFLVERANRPDFVKLLDFGVAKLADPDGVGVQLGTTAVGMVVGTPEYMSPEQAAGETVDHRTDLYALGVILYEMVTGVVPFRGKSFGELVVKHMTVPPRRPNAVTNLPHVVPPALEELILELLAKDREQRPASMADVETRLREIHDDLAPPMELDLEHQLARAASEPTSVRMPRLPTAPVSGHEPTLAGWGDGNPTGDDLEDLMPPRHSRGWWLVAVAAVAMVAIVGWIATRARPAETVASASPAVAREPASPVEPSEVLIRFESTPAGAFVHVVGSEEVLGATPFSRRFPRADHTVEFAFELAGHAPATQRISLGANASIASALTGLPPAASPSASRSIEPPTIRPAIPGPKPRTPSDPPASRPKRIDRATTMDVFDN